MNTTLMELVNGRASLIEQHRKIEDDMRRIEGEILAVACPYKAGDIVDIPLGHGYPKGTRAEVTHVLFYANNYDAAHVGFYVNGYVVKKDGTSGVRPARWFERVLITMKVAA